MSTFALIHGAWSSGRAWDDLVPELGARGHAAVAMDLPCDRPDATFEDYADAVIEAVGGADDLVLVGHSLGGVTLPFVARRRRVRGLVYVCGVIPGTRETWGRPGEPPSDPPGIFDVLAKDDERCSSWPPGAEPILFADLAPEEVPRAAAWLRRQCGGIWRSFEPFDRLPDVPCASLVARRDAIVEPAWSVWAAERRLGVAPIWIEGGHWPMLTDPAGLAERLITSV